MDVGVDHADDHALAGVLLPAVHALPHAVLAGQAEELGGGVVRGHLLVRGHREHVRILGQTLGVLGGEVRHERVHGALEGHLRGDAVLTGDLLLLALELGLVVLHARVAGVELGFGGGARCGRGAAGLGGDHGRGVLHDDEVPPGGELLGDGALRAGHDAGALGVVDRPGGRGEHGGAEQAQAEDGRGQTPTARSRGEGTGHEASAFLNEVRGRRAHPRPPARVRSTKVT